MSDEEDLFARAMGAVRPIKQKKKRINPEKRPSARPHPTPRSQTPLPLPMTSAAPPQPSTDDPWTLKNSGISQERLKKLAAGNPPARTELDLHGMTRDEALQALQGCVEEALARGDRAICVVHGRGLHSQGRPVLKEAVYQWLRSGPCAGLILAAIPKPHTGGGSALILLRRQR